MDRQPSVKRAKECFLLAAVILLLVGFLSYQGNRRLIRSFDWISESHQSIQTLQYLQTLQEYAEASVRAYVITGDALRLEPFRVGRANIENEFQLIAPRFEKSDNERKAFERLHQLTSAHLTYLGRIIQQRQSAGFSAAAQTIAVEDETSHRFELERLLAELEHQEESLLRQRWAQTLTVTFYSKVAAVVGTFLSLFLLSGAYLLLRRESRERFGAEREMERAQSFLHSVLEHIPYSIVVKEAEHLRFTLVNKAAEQWFNRSREALLGSNAFDLYERHDAEAIAESDRELLKSGQIGDITEEKVNPAGTPDRIAHTQKIPIIDESGFARFILSISEDITERKQSEKVLQMAHAAALETARFKSEFIANMSHEIRTPIAIMTGMTALLMDTELDPQQKKFAASVHRAGENLSAIAKTVLDFSNIEAGKFTLQSTSVDVRAISQGAIDMLKEQAQSKKLSMACLIAHEIPVLMKGDASRLRQVLAQILGNAVKFSREGEVILRATLLRQSDAQLWIHFRISDTGIGIAKEAQGHVFDAFRQGDGSATRRFGGMGLGLTIAKRTVELMGGEIGLDSVLGKGSTFWWTVPFNRADAAIPLTRAPQLPWNQARVLVVDENALHREMVRQHLSDLALASEAVPTGEAALETLRRESSEGRKFQICLVDMHLPDMDATHFSRLLAADPSLADLKCVAMTEGQVPDLEALRALGFSRCLKKPIHLSALRDGLLAVIDPSHQHAA